MSDAWFSWASRVTLGTQGVDVTRKLLPEAGPSQPSAVVRGLGVSPSVSDEAFSRALRRGIRYPRRPFSALAKPMGAACNLDCTYCFFLSKEHLYDHARQRMSESMLTWFLTNFLDAQPDGAVTVEWQGGEPMLRGLPFFRHAIKLAEQLKRPGQTVYHSIQTNGTLLTDEWGEFLAKHHVLVGLSMDGPARYHDAYRVNKAGRGTHAMVLRGWKILQKYGVDTNILCTVHAANADHPLEVYRYFRDELGARFIQFIPIVERVTEAEVAIAENGWHTTGLERPLYRQNGDAVTSRSVSPEAWGRFLSAVFDEWVTRDVGEVFVQHFDVAVGNAVGRYSLCVHSPVCGAALATLPDGAIYACDHWVEPGYERGNVETVSFREVLDSAAQRRFGRAKRTRLPRQCRECPVLWACQGGCPKDRFVRSDAAGAEERHPLNYLCPGYRAFFTHISPSVRRIVSLLQAGRPAADIMRDAAGTA